MGGPTVVFGADPATAEVTELSRHDALDEATPLRGGSQGVPHSVQRSINFR